MRRVWQFLLARGGALLLINRTHHHEFIMVARFFSSLLLLFLFRAASSLWVVTLGGPILAFRATGGRMTLAFSLVRPQN